MAHIKRPPPLQRRDDDDDPGDASNTSSSSSTVTCGSTTTAGTSTLADLCWSASGATDDGQSNRTSNASSTLPWAEETVAENRQLWQSIEEMLYGERELPAAGALRAELQQWQRHWPHLRVRGERVPVTTFFGTADDQLLKEPTTTASGRWAGEEVFAIHPPASADISRCNWKRPTVARTAAPSGDAERMLEHCLRISSSSWSRRPTTTMLPNARHTFRRKPATSALVADCDASDSDEREPRIHSVRSEIQRVRYNDDDDDGGVEQAGIFPVLRARALHAMPSPSAYRLHPFRPLLAGCRLLQASAQSSGPDVRQSGNAAIRRRTILPPIADRLPSGAAGRPVIRQALPATAAATSTTASSIGDLFGRSVSAVYVPSLNI